MLELYLNPTQVKRLIKKAEREEEVIVIRCVRKTPASKPGGPDKDELYDLHCAILSIAICLPDTSMHRGSP